MNINKEYDSFTSIFVPDLAGGGAERVVVNVAVGLSDRGVPVEIVLARSRGPYLDLVPDRVNVVDLKARHPYLSLGKLLRYLRERRPNALISVGERANLLALLAKHYGDAPTRFIISIHNTLSVHLAGSNDPKKRIFLPVFRGIAHLADEAIAVSGGVAEDFCRLFQFPRDRVHVIYNPVVTSDLFRFAALPVEHSWLQSDDAPVIISIGRLSVQKDYPALIRAFGLVRNRRRARLLILGEGPERDMITSLIHDLGLDEDVQMPGFVENPYAYLSRSRLFVLSSRWEGLPTVLIEALACGVPVISTDCPSGPREILDGGRYGRLVPVGDVEALASAINQNLDAPLARPPRTSYRPYSMEDVTAQYLSLLRPEPVAPETIS